MFDPGGLVGTTLGRYTITKLIAVGGMGAVYLGEHPAIGSKVAIKVLLPYYLSDPIMTRRFLDEARAVNRIEHPGIIRVHDCGEQEDLGAYLVMEYLEGETLEQRLEEHGPLPPASVLRLLRQAASALCAAHDAGIVHRDLKPSNIFVVADPDVDGGERVKILDFGIAKLLEGAARIDAKTKTGVALGTPRFMSPEQCLDAKGVDHRTDIYSLAVIGYLLLSNRLPLATDGSLLLFAKQVDKPVSLMEIGVTVPPRLDEVLLEALAPDREQRFQTMAALRDALSGVDAGGDLPDPPAEVGAMDDTAAAIPPTQVQPRTEGREATPADVETVSDEPAREDTPAGAETVRGRPGSARESTPVEAETVLERPSRAGAPAEAETLIEGPENREDVPVGAETLLYRPRAPGPALADAETHIKDPERARGGPALADAETGRDDDAAARGFAPAAPSRVVLYAVLGIAIVIGLLLFLVILAQGCTFWPQDNPRDPSRCDPRCSGDKICWNGQCISPDAGPGTDTMDARADGGADLGQDQEIQPDGQGPACITGWTAPTPLTQSHLQAVWGSSASDVFAVGAGGTILHFDGSAWTSMSSTTTENLHAVWGTGPQDVYAAGANGTLLRYDGSKWAADASFTGSGHLYGVWSTAGAVFAVGASGSIFHWNGTAWSTTTQGIADLRAVFGTAKSNVYAAGGSEVYHYDGASWSPVPGSSGAMILYKGVWGVEQTLWVVGALSVTGSPNTGQIDKIEAGQLVSLQWGKHEPLNAVWGSLNGAAELGSTPGDIFAVGDGGTVLYFDGSQWIPQQAGATVDLNGVWRSEDNQLFVVGDLGTILHHVGPWKPVPKQTTKSLAGIWGSGPDNVVVAGEQGTVLRFDGAAWHSELAGKEHLNGIWGDGTGVLYTVSGYGTSFGGIVQQYSNGSWSEFHGSITPLTGIWGSGTGELVAVGYKLIDHYASSQWQAHEQLQTIFMGVWGSGTSDIYAVGNGNIYHFDGTSWSEDMSTPTSEILRGVWGSGPGDIYVVGAKGTILHGTVGSWQPVSSTVTAELFAVWGSSATDVYAAGQWGTILHYDGTGWQSTVSGTSYTLKGVWGSGATDVYAIGGGGTVLHWCGP